MDIDKFFHKRMAEHSEVRETYDLVQKKQPDCRVYEKEPWTFLKLVVVGYYMDVYSNIAKKNFEKIAYLDLFAGSGLNYIQKLDLYLGGSPYIAANRPRLGKEFNNIILFELDQNKCQTLHLVVPKAAIYCLDCNSKDALNIVGNAISNHRHFLAFIDPEGIREIKWSTLENIFAFRGDIIVNYPYSVVERQHGLFFGRRSEKVKKRTGQLLDKFFGNQLWREIPNRRRTRGSQLLNLYLKGLSEYFPCQEIIQLGQERGGYKYHLIVATKKENARWFAPVRDVKQMVSKVTFSELERFAETFRGKQRRLTDFF